MKKGLTFLIYLIFCGTFCYSQWQPDFRLTNDPAVSRLCGNTSKSICTYLNYVHVVWEDTRDSDSGEVYYKRSTDNGLNWGPDIRLTNNQSHSEYASIACAGTVLHVIWLDMRDGNFELYYKRSSNNGINWTSDVRLTNSLALTFSPSFTVTGNKIHITFYR